MSTRPFPASTVPYALLADLLLLAHGAFVLFVIAGGLLVLRWPRVAWAHLPAALWGAGIEFTGRICPLTPIENAWRQAAGEAAYRGGFIEHYVTAALYPAGLTRTTQLVLGVIVVAVNGGAYWTLWRRRPSLRSPA
jgi:Protein of Unknown function (DUF2784)